MFTRKRSACAIHSALFRAGCELGPKGPVTGALPRTLPSIREPIDARRPLSGICRGHRPVPGPPAGGHIQPALPACSSHCAPPPRIPLLLPTRQAGCMNQLCAIDTAKRTPTQVGAVGRLQTVMGLHLRAGVCPAVPPPPLLLAADSSAAGRSSSPSTNDSPAEGRGGACKNFNLKVGGKARSTGSGPPGPSRRAPDAASAVPSADREAQSSGRSGAASGYRLDASPVHEGESRGVDDARTRYLGAAAQVEEPASSSTMPEQGHPRTRGDVDKVHPAVGPGRHHAMAAAAAGQQAAGQQRRVELQVLQAGALPHVLRAGGPRWAEAGERTVEAAHVACAACATRARHSQLLKNVMSTTMQ